MSVILAPLLSIWDIDPQDASPLFNGTLPAEIRLEIFRLALTPHVQPWRFFYDCRKKNCTDDAKVLVLGHPKEEEDGGLDLTSSSATFHPATCVAWAHEGRYCSRLVLSLGLIGTCRRALAEARAFVHQTSERTIWRLGVSHGLRKSTISSGEMNWGRQRRKWERLFPRMSIVGHPNMTGDFFHRAVYRSHLAPFVNVQHLSITVPDHELFCRGDNGARERPYFKWLNPFGEAEDVEAAVEATKGFNLAESLAAAPPSLNDDRPAWMPPGVSFWHANAINMAWGRAFVNMPRLETLIFRFEARENDQAEVERMVQWALRVWQLPLNPNLNGGWHFLSPEAVVQRTTSRYTCQAINFLWEEVEDYVNRLTTNMCSWTLRWTRKKYNGLEVYPYGGLITVVPDKDVTDGNVDDSDIDLYGD